tara:strand:- start:1305 stop:1598 length:294 start_codon:yes stop_codon:yes gene_type:complete
MKLLTRELLKKLPPIGHSIKTKEEPQAIVKWFTPDSNWTWYVAEYNPEDGMCWGLVDGFEKEFGYFTIDEIQKLKGPLKLPIERDMWFEKCNLNSLV